jgi:hypothetical protein
LAVSYENFVPTSAAQNEALAAWTKNGGALIVLGGAPDLQGKPFWWTQAGHASPLHHLLGLLESRPGADVDRACGRGRLVQRAMSPRELAKGSPAADRFVECLSSALSDAQPAHRIQSRPFLVERDCRSASNHAAGRDTFIAAHSLNEPLEIDGPAVDVLDADLPVRQRVQVQPGQSVLLRKVTQAMRDKKPRVLHCTHRLMGEQYDGARSRLLLRGPAGTPAAVRMFAAGRSIAKAAVIVGDKEQPAPQVRPDENGTVLFTFDNVPQGAELVIDWKR